MSESISSPDSECTDLIQLQGEINKYLHAKLGEYTKNDSSRQYGDIATELPDRICEVLVLLYKLDVNSHQILWLHCVLRLARVAAVFVGMDQNPELLANAREFHAKMAVQPRIQDVFGAISKFLSNWDMASLHAENEKIRWYERLEFLLLTQELSDLIIMGQLIVADAEDTVLLAEKLAALLAAERDETHEQESGNLQEEVFPVLVNVAHAAFVSGQPEAVVPLVFENKLVDESTATDLLRNLDVHLFQIMDFYRYFGYCFATLAASGPVINQKCTDYADVFFRVLLKLPNLQLSNYHYQDKGMGLSSRTSLQYFSSSDREELSFFFLLNSHLRYTSLAQYIRLDELVRQETRYFTPLLHSRVSKELELSASSSQSYSNSTVSMAALEQRVLQPPSKESLRSKTLSSIMFDGTYKEQVSLMLEFFEAGWFLNKHGENRKPVVKLVGLFNMSGTPSGSTITTKMANDDILHYVRNIDTETYPGKALFVQAIDKAVRLLELLTVSHFSDSVGLLKNPDELISTIYGTGHTFQDIQVKQLAKLDSGGVSRIPIDSPEDDQIALQMEILRRSRALEKCTQKLV